MGTRYLPVIAQLVLAAATAGCAAGPASEFRVAPDAMSPATSGDSLRGSSFLPVRFDRDAGKLYLTVRTLGEPLLYTNALATGLGSTEVSLDRGQPGTSGIVRFERQGPRLLLTRESSVYRAVEGDSALRSSIEESFPKSVIATFAIDSDRAGEITVDATEFFLSDVFGVIGRLREAQLGTVRLEPERSYIDAEHTRAFPTNTEVRAVLSFASDAPAGALRRISPDGRGITLQQHHSFTRLPERQMERRPFDPRAGVAATGYFDFSQPLTSDLRQRATVRWRLEPTDTAAYLRGEKVPPLRPITYYLDPGIPEPYRSAYRDGGSWWNEIFEAAGWLDAFRIDDLPPGADPMDGRYPMLLAVHRDERGPSYGSRTQDPRSGEILTAGARMDSYRSFVDHDIYMGLVPAAGPSGLQLSAEEFAMARRRQHAAHEIGHTLGFPHNFVAATQGRSSVLDYPYPLVQLDGAGGVDISSAYRPSGGAHDTLAVRYAYTWYPSAAAEADGLRAIVREAEGRGLRFVPDRYAAPNGSYPAATRWVEGDDMIQALERTMAVRRTLLDSFDERAALPGEPLAVLNRRFAHVYLHHRYALQGAIKYVGGMQFGFALRGEATQPTHIVPAAEQRRALRLILENLQPAALRIPERVSSLIPPVPPGYDDDLTLIPSPAGPAFDPIATAHALAQEIVDGLLNPQRTARVASFHARDATYPALGEVLGALVEATWGATSARQDDSSNDRALHQAAQRAVLDGLLDLAGDAAATPGVRADAELQLTELLDRTDAATAPPQDLAHRAMAHRDIERYFDGRDSPDARRRPAPVPLPWP